MVKVAVATVVVSEKVEVVGVFVIVWVATVVLTYTVDAVWVVLALVKGNFELQND